MSAEKIAMAESSEFALLSQQFYDMPLTDNLSPLLRAISIVVAHCASSKTAFTSASKPICDPHPGQ